MLIYLCNYMLWKLAFYSIVLWMCHLCPGVHKTKLFGYVLCDHGEVFNCNLQVLLRDKDQHTIKMFTFGQ